jgi:ferredoxin-nitrite reductase
VAEARQIADLAEKYSPNGEIRFTVEQNLLLPNVDNDKVKALLAEPALNGDSRLTVTPGRLVGNLVSCTGSQFCGLAVIETKQNAESIASIVEQRVDMPRDVRMHFTGCPNSCGQVQAADIGLMGGPAKKKVDGKLKAVPGVKMFLGGTIGEKGKLSLEVAEEGIPVEDLVPHLTEVLIQNFDATIKPEFAEEHKAWTVAKAVEEAAKAQEAAVKAAKKKVAS